MNNALDLILFVYTVRSTKRLSHRFKKKKKKTQAGSQDHCSLSYYINPGCCVYCGQQTKRGRKGVLWIKFHPCVLKRRTFVYAANRNVESKCCAHVRLAAVSRGDGASLLYSRGVYTPQDRLFFAKIEIGAQRLRDEIIAVTHPVSAAIV